MRLFWLGMSWLAGIVAGRQAGLPAWFYLVGIALGIAARFIEQPDRPPAAAPARRGSGPSLGQMLSFDWMPVRRVGPFLALASLAALRMTLASPVIDQFHISNFNDLHQPVTVTGVIVDYPDLRDGYVGLRLEAELVQLAGTQDSRPAGGLLLVQADRFGEYQYGDRVAATGFPETPPEDEQFSYREYLARRGVLTMMDQASVVRLARRQASPLLQLVFGLRQRAFETVHDLFPDPEASLLAGILLGLESGISPEVRETFNTTSTTHIIAISGFNLTVLAALVIRLFGRWLGIRRGALAATLTIGLYTLLVGADPAVVRAAIMSGLALYARFLGRRADGLASLSAAAVLMTVIHPQVLWDVGFQLSFAATLGLVLYADPIQAWFVKLASRWMTKPRAERLAGPVGEYLLFTLAAQTTTLPLTMAYFQRLSLSSLLANPVILPAQPPLMILGGVATIVGMLFRPLGKLLALLAWPFPAFTIRAVAFFAAIPRSSLVLGQISAISVVLIYAALFGATWLASLPVERRPAIPYPSRPALVFGLAIFTAITWREIATRPDGRTHLTLFDSGSRLVESTEGRFVLIGGGDSPIALSQQLGRRMPLLNRRIDWLVVPDTSQSQMLGLVDLGDRYSVGAVLVPSLIGGSAFRSVIGDLQTAGIQVVQAERGRRLRLGPDSWLLVLDRNETRMSLELVDGRAHVLLLADSDPLTSESPLNLGPPSALAVHDPDHSDWVAQLHPWLAIATGHPIDPSAWPLRTELHGWIELITDGQRLWVQSQHPATLGPGSSSP